MIDNDLKQELLDFVNLDISGNIGQEQYNFLLSEASLFDRGIFLFDLQFESKETYDKKRNKITFKTKENFSRFRLGDSVYLETESEILNGVVLDNKLDKVTVLIPSSKKITESIKWSIRYQNFGFSNSVFRALEEMDVGKPGWGLFEFFIAKKKLPLLKFPPKVQLDNEYLDKICNEFLGDDKNKIEILKKCLSLPLLYAVQGPPGTGKTLLVSLLAEILAHMGLRVLILAFTHQAVNNVLNQLSTINPARHIVKIGDEFKNDSLDENILRYTFKDFREVYKGRGKEETPVLGMSFHSALPNIGVNNSEFKPNVVLIDEAGQLSLSLGIFAGLFGASSIQVFGDDAQMPPIYSSEVKNHSFAVSLFSRIRDIDDSLLDTINTSYRMNGELTRIVGQNFYCLNGTSFLNAAEKNASRKFKYFKEISLQKPFDGILNEDSFVWINCNEPGSSQVNKKESKIVAEIVGLCIKNGISNTDVAVITPFRKQAAYITKLLLNSGLPSAELPIVDTVERVQGQSVELIIISFTASDPEYIKMQGEFLFSLNRLNVSISRAKTKVIMMMSEEFLKCLPHEYKTIKAQNVLRALLSNAVRYDL